MTSARKREWDHDRQSDGRVNHAAAARREGREDGHVLQRSVTVVKDQVLGIGEPGSRHGGELVVAGDAYAAIEEEGAYWCSCGEEFDGVDDAEAHLLDVGGYDPEDATVEERGAA